MIESIIILLIFSLAVFYIGKTFIMPFISKSNAGCAKGCGSCGAVDFDKIVSNQIAKKATN